MKINWDDYFMTMVYLVASRSKDKNTHVGAVVVGPDKEIRSTGYNSFPRGIIDWKDERQERPEKYYWMAHAEINAITNAALIGVSLKDCTLYTNGIPCATCGRAIINAGIQRVVVDSRWKFYKKEKWEEEAERTLQMFKEADISVRYWLGEFVKIERFSRK